MDVVGFLMVVAGGLIVGWAVGNPLSKWVTARYYRHKVAKMEQEIGHSVMAQILPQTAFTDPYAFERHFVTADGTVETADVEYVKAWLDQVTDRLKEVGIHFVASGWYSIQPGAIRWTVSASDPESTRDEMAVMVGRAIDEAGGVPA